MGSRMLQEIHDQVDVLRRLAQAPMAALRAEVRRAGRLVLMGTGASLLACRAGAYGFLQYGATLPVVLPAADVDYLLPAVGPETLVLLASQSGQSFETQRAIGALKQQGVRFWGLTNAPASLLAQRAELTLHLAAGAEVSSATKTYTATLLLLLRLAGLDDQAEGEWLRLLPDDVEQSLAAAAVEPWAAALAAQPVLYVLGTGCLGPTAAQAALLLKEKTAIPTEGLSLSEFRHGHIEVVRPGLPLLIATARAEAAVALQHAEYLAGLGAHLFLVTDTPLTSVRIPPERILCVRNSGDAVTAQVTAVLPFQLLAEQIATLQGRDVDGFRYIAKTVDQYRL